MTIKTPPPSTKPSNVSNATAKMSCGTMGIIYNGNGVTQSLVVDRDDRMASLNDSSPRLLEISGSADLIEVSHIY